MQPSPQSSKPFWALVVVCGVLVFYSLLVTVALCACWVREATLFCITFPCMCNLNTFKKFAHVVHFLFNMINIILVQIQKFQMRSCGAQCQQKATFCPPSENILHCPSQRRMRIISKCKLLNSHYNFLPKNSCNFICQEKAFAGDLFILLIIMS